MPSGTFEKAGGRGGVSARIWPVTYTGRRSDSSVSVVSPVPWPNGRPDSTWRCIHTTRHDTGLPGFVPTLDELLERSDIVSLHVPLNESTRHLIGAAQLDRMKPTAVLINTARGPVVDEDALVDALEAGSIYAAGLDVYDGEPRVSQRVLSAPRTTLLPHIGSATIQTRTRMARLACQGVCDVLAGRTPPNVVAATSQPT